jgi:hypothetical protein
MPDWGLYNRRSDLLDLFQVAFGRLTVRASPGCLRGLGLPHSKFFSMVILSGCDGRLKTLFGDVRPGQILFLIWLRTQLESFSLALVTVVCVHEGAMIPFRHLLSL